MNSTITFARHFARLVWLLRCDSAAVDEQKVALRALVTVSKDGAVALAARGRRIAANGQAVPDALPGVSELAAQLGAHGVRELRVEREARAADLLGAARILAADAAPGDSDGRAAAQKLDALGSTTVQLVVAAEGQESSGQAPVAAAATAGARADASSAGVLKGEAALGDLEMELLSPEESDAVSSGRPTGDAAAIAAPERGAAASAAPAVADAPAATSEPQPLAADGSFLAFAAPPKPRDDVRALLAELDGAKSPHTLARLLDEVVTTAERAARDGEPATAATIFSEVVRREGAAAADGPLRAAYTMALRRLSRPSMLRIVARMFAHRPGQQEEEYAAVLTRAGEDGAEALIEELAEATSLADRRAYFNALVRLKAGVPALVHMLGDARWYVVRNAADLIGELKAAEADVALCEVLRHDDERVRRAATAALGKLGTPRAVQGLQQALRDAAPPVRTQAAVGLGTQKGKSAAGASLAEALESETDAEVALSILAALGRVGTPDAVQRLIRVAQPDGRLFKKKPVAERVAAVHALGEARTPAALDALSSLLTDKEKEVRDAAVRVFRSGKNGA